MKHTTKHKANFFAHDMQEDQIRSNVCVNGTDMNMSMLAFVLIMFVHNMIYGAMPLSGGGGWNYITRVI